MWCGRVVVFLHVLSLSLHYTAKPEPPKFIVCIDTVEEDEGSDATFSCQAYGRPVPEIIWRRSGEEINSTNNRIVIKNHLDEDKLLAESTLIVVDIMPERDNGVYEAEAINIVGNDICEATLTGR
jgi:hypothetical protein